MILVNNTLFSAEIARKTDISGGYRIVFAIFAAEF
jgi:hypothetical protein